MSIISHRIRLLAQWAVGFFVDDGVNALLTIAWIGIVLAITRVIPARAWQGVLLTVGLNALFAISIMLRVRHTRGRTPVRDDITEEALRVTAEE